MSDLITALCGDENMKMNGVFATPERVMKLGTHYIESELLLRMIVIWMTIVTCKKPFNAKISLGL
jgi:hypothetical protein